MLKGWTESGNHVCPDKYRCHILSQTSAFEPIRSVSASYVFCNLHRIPRIRSRGLGWRGRWLPTSRTVRPQGSPLCLWWWRRWVAGVRRQSTLLGALAGSLGIALASLLLSQPVTCSSVSLCVFGGKPVVGPSTIALCLGGWCCLIFICVLFYSQHYF